MLPPLLIGVFFMLIAAIASATFSLTGSVTANRKDYLQSAQLAVTQAVSYYYKETGAFPTSLSAMASTPGYWQLRQYLPATDLIAKGAAYQAVAPVRVVRSNKLAIGTDTNFYNYYRVGIYAPVDGNVTDANFLSSAGNKCPRTGDVSGFAGDLAWCGDATKAATSSVTDRQLALEQQTAAQQAQQSTADIFITRYNAVYTLGAATAFPAAVAAVTLASRVTASAGASVGTSPATCTGTFYWVQAAPAPYLSHIVLGCADLYNYWGNPVYYRKVSNKQVVFTSNSRFLQADGLTPLVLTTTATLAY